MPVSLEDARAWMRLGAVEEDAAIERLIAAATNICEAFIGQWLIIREGSEVVPLRGAAARLVAVPVGGVDAVARIAAGGDEAPLEAAHYRVTIVDGAASISVTGASAGTQLRIAYRAGLAVDAAGVPEAIRHGILRMVQHLYEARDGSGEAPPAMVAALWQPWRRMTIGGAR